MQNDPVKQIIIIRKDLKMRTGKACAQASHASLGAILSITKNDIIMEDNDIKMNRRCLQYAADSMLAHWLDNEFTKICVYVNSEQELLDLEISAKNAGLVTCLIKDLGKTEFNNIPTYTALAIGPAFDSMLKPITGHLPLL